MDRRNHVGRLSHRGRHPGVLATAGHCPVDRRRAAHPGLRNPDRPDAAGMATRVLAQVGLLVIRARSWHRGAAMGLHAQARRVAGRNRRRHRHRYCVIDLSGIGRVVTCAPLRDVCVIRSTETAYRDATVFTSAATASKRPSAARQITRRSQRASGFASPQSDPPRLTQRASDPSGARWRRDPKAVR
jgi:hypothetical protein